MPRIAARVESPARKLNKRQLESSRAMISTGMIITRLQGHIEGRIAMTLSQVQASKILLDKVLPNLGEMKVDMNTDGVMFNLNMSAPKVLTQGGDVIDVKEVVEVAESKVDW